MAALAAALSGPDGQEALELVRGLIERAEVFPAAAGGGPEIVLTGEIGAMVRLALGRSAAPVGPAAAVSGPSPDLFMRSVKVVAGTGFEPVTFRL